MTSTRRDRGKPVTRAFRAATHRGVHAKPSWRMGLRVLAEGAMLWDKVGVREYPRYRVEDGEPCVDVQIVSIERLFDRRDPAPFLERALDPGLVDYLLAAVEELAPHDRFRVVFWLDRPCHPGEIEAAVHAHFAYALDRLERQRRKQRRIGQISLVLGVAVIVALLSLAQLVVRMFPGSIGAALREGLVISSWVVIWRPVEILIYDWIPVRRERRVMHRLQAAPIVVRGGAGPGGNPMVCHPVADVCGGPQVGRSVPVGDRAAVVSSAR
jgi:hypothetical protein